MSNENKTIHTASGDPIDFLEKTYENYLDKTTFIFGGTGSGKSTVISEILYLCKDYIPNYYVLAPENSRGGYVKNIHPKCVKSDISKMKLQKIWQRQEHVTQIYKIANDPVILKTLFCKINDNEALHEITQITHIAKNKIQEIEHSTLSYDQRQGQINNIIEIRDRKVLAIYKKTIRQNRQYLLTLDLELDEKTAVTYLDINPRLMLIIDDCSELMKKWYSYFGKNEVNVFESILYRGRHNFITLIFACHDDKLIATELRKNARVVVYTSSQSLISSINKQGNGFSKLEKKRFEEVAEVLFRDEKLKNEFKTHKKFCFLREDANPYKYTIAIKNDNYKLGCDYLLELADKMPKQPQTLTSNPYLQDLVEPRDKAVEKPKVINGNKLLKNKPRLKWA